MQIADHLHAFLWDSPRVNNCNTFLIDAGARVLIDPGHAAFFDHVRSGLDALGIALADIDLVIGTHAHPDHIEAVSVFQGLPARFALHREEWRLVEEMGPYLKAALGVDPAAFMPDFFLTEGDLTVKDVTLQIHHTPGHSSGSICIHWPRAEALFSGDLIFAGGLGRTDLPGGNGALLKESIRRMAALENIRYLLSGHGPVIDGADAVRRNFETVEQTWFAFV